MVFDLGVGEMLLIAVLVIVFVGPDGLPDLMRVLGRFYGQMRRASDDLRRTFNAEVARVDADRRREELRQRRLERERLRAAAAEASGEGEGAASPAGAAPAEDPLDDGPDEPAVIPPDPRLPPDAAPRAVPRPSPTMPRPRPADARPADARPANAPGGAPAEPRAPEAGEPAPTPPADPREH